MDTYADDLAALVEKLASRTRFMSVIRPVAAKVARYIGRHGTKRVAKAVLIGAVPPLMLKPPPIPAACRWRCSDPRRRHG
jgi:non-heme chloroperoxidase